MDDEEFLDKVESVLKENGPMMLGGILSHMDDISVKEYTKKHMYLMDGDSRFTRDDSGRWHLTSGSS
jgi:hypothetical protein